MRVGLFCNEYPPRPHGGIGTFVYLFAHELARYGHEVTVVEFGDKPGRRSDGERIEVVTLREFRWPHVSWFINRVSLLRWLSSRGGGGKLDVFEIPEYQGWLPFPVEPLPIVLRLHHSESHINWMTGNKSFRYVVHWLEKLTLSNHRSWIAVSRYILDKSIEHFGSRPSLYDVIHNPAPGPPSLMDGTPDLREFTKYILFVGTVGVRKGALLLAEAARPLLSSDPQLGIVYVGKEDKNDGFPVREAILERVGTENRRKVLFTGQLPHEDVWSWYRKAAVFVLPSRIESFSLVALEAMSQGIPVIVPSEGPFPEFIRHGWNGILLDKLDADSLSRDLRSLLDSTDMRMEIGERARETVAEKFNPGEIVRRSLDFYAGVLDRWRSRQRAIKGGR